MQQAELEVARQRDANLTALAAIGPRKRKQLDLSTYSPASSSHHSIVDTQIFEDNQAQVSVIRNPSPCWKQTFDYLSHAHKLTLRRRIYLYYNAIFYLLFVK